MRGVDRAVQRAPMLPEKGPQTFVPQATVVPQALPVPLLRPLEMVCRDALAYSQNNAAVRKSILSLFLALRGMAHRRHGHDTPDILPILKLLQRAGERTKDDARPVPLRDPLLILEERRLLSPVHLSAAMLVIDIFRGYGRLLAMRAQGYGRGNDKGARHVIQPVEVLGEELWWQHLHVYAPWYRGASKRLVRGTRLSGAKLVLDILVSGFHPHQVDNLQQWPKGRALRALRRELEELAHYQKNPVIVLS